MHYYYPMLKHGIDQVCISRTPLSVLGTTGGSVLGTNTGFTSDVIKHISDEVYAIPMIIIIRNKQA